MKVIYKNIRITRWHKDGVNSRAGTTKASLGVFKHIGIALAKGGYVTLVQTTHDRMDVEIVH